MNIYEIIMKNKYEIQINKYEKIKTEEWSRTIKQKKAGHAIYLE